MKERLSYRGCTARVQFDPHDHILVGHVLHIDEPITFHAESLAEFTAAFHEAIDDYLAATRDGGAKPQNASPRHSRY